MTPRARRAGAFLGALSLLAPGCGRDPTAPTEERPTPTTAPTEEGTARLDASARDLSASASASSASPPPAPSPVASASLPPLPASVVKVLATAPYVEERCVAAAEPGFPEARRCNYTAMGLEAEVLVANPSAEATTAWLVDAASACAPLDAIRESAPEHWERGVRAFARHLRHQSSRIFPLRGAIVEDLGDGPHAFGFDRGVVTPCTKGSCRCRMNSLTSTALCKYRASRGEDPDCARRLSDDEAWRAHCAENHARALTTGVNEHLRARAFLTGEAVRKKCEARAARPRGKACEPFEIVLLLEAELGLGP